MDAGDSWRLALLVVCLALSGFFSASETAFIALPRARLLHLVRRGQPRANRVAQLLQRPERFLATVLLGNNLVNTAGAALATVLAISLIGNDTLAVLVATLGVTLVLLLFGETLPKTVAWHRSEQVAFALSRPLTVVGFILSPAVRLLQGFSTLTNKALGISGMAAGVGDEEIRTLIAAGAQTGTVEATEAALLEKVFRFGDRQMREIMTPRPEIVWLERGTSLANFLSVYRESSHTRFPVFDGTMENVVGVLSVKDVLSGMSGGAPDLQNEVTGMLRPAFFVPETKSVSETFGEMRQGGHTVVLTVDEFGGIAGVVTLTRILELIVGRTGEEGLKPSQQIISIGENTFELDGAMSIDEANDRLALDLPDGDYNTIAGFVLENVQRIPDNGYRFRFNELRFRITAVDGNKISRVEVRVPVMITPESQPVG